jgi:glutamate synthase domain-containing protein 2
MIELKLSQGAKPAHGGILPAAKVTPLIAEARGVAMGRDCLSPLRHSAFSGPRGMLLFIQQLRTLSGGKPVGIKLCVGQPADFAALVRAMIELDITPDFVTVDGAEGGTGAAPPEFSNSVGAPMEEGLSLVHAMLCGAGLRPRVKLIAAGKILTGFGVVRTLALGADTCNAARAMMFALGCIQALKCNSNACPSGVATQNPELTAGLVPEDKALRVYRYHHATVASALEIVGAMGLRSPAEVQASQVMRRVSATQALSFAELHPPVDAGCLLRGEGPAALQAAWDEAGDRMASRDAPREELLGRAAAAVA